MLREIIRPGDKFELEMLNFEKKTKKITYSSKIYDIIEEDKIKAAIPIQKGAIVPLALNSKYELFIYSKSGLYKCRATLLDRYKEDKLYVMVLEIYTGLQKHQRREHYRLNCNLNLKYRTVTDKEADVMMRVKPLEKGEVIQQKDPDIIGITLDISGGGMRFVSGHENHIDDYIIVDFSIPVADKLVPYSLLAKVVATREVPNKKHTYEHRIKFELIPIRERELLIKYIFQEERRFRKNEKG